MSHIARHRGRKTAAATLVAAAAIALTACQDNGSGAAGPASSASSAPSAAASDSPSAAGSSSAAGGEQTGAATDSDGATAAQSPSGSAAGGAGTTSARSAASHDTSGDRCTSAQMGLRLGRADIGAGNIRYSLTFTNNGKSSCTLRGYPGVSLLQRDGQTVGRPATREGAAGGAVTLAPGASAHAVLHTINDGLKDAPCWKSAQLVQAYPPGSTEAMTARTSGLRVCGDEFTVTTVSTGAGE